MRWIPTRKWFAALVTAVAGLVGTWSANNWTWNNTLTGAAVTVAQLLVAYLIPNQATPGGVPQQGGPAF